MKIIWHNKASQDLNNTIKYIAKRSPQNAIIVLNKLTDLVDSLNILPYRYPVEPIYNKDNIRFIAKWSFKIIYRIEADVIYILRIFNTNQHPNKIKYF